VPEKDQTALRFGLSKQQVDQFWKEGYLVFPALLAEDVSKWMQVFDKCVEKSRTLEAGQGKHWNKSGYVLAVDESGNELSGQLSKIQSLCVYEPQTLEIAKSPMIVDKVQSLLGSPDIDMFGSKFFPLLPGGTSVNWHQDNHYFGTDSNKIISCAIYWENTNRDNGCLKIIPRSMGRVQPHQPGSGIWALGEWIQDVDESKSIDIEVPAGSVVLFSSLLMHAAHQNRTPDKTRYSVFWHYLPGDHNFAWRGTSFGRGEYQDRHIIRQA